MQEFWITEVKQDSVAKKRNSSDPEDTVRRPYPVGATTAFVLVTLLWATALINTYVAKIPGFWAAVQALKGFGDAHFGFFVFLLTLAGTALASVFSRVPEISLSGLRIRNPLHLASSDKERLQFEQEQRRWAEEREELERKVQALAGERETAATNVDIYEFALKTCCHQDSVLEKLFEAFHADDQYFHAVFRQTMDWLAHLAKQLVVLQDRSLTCTVMSYDPANDQCELIGEVGTRPTRSGSYSPRRGIGIAGRALATGEPQIVPDVARNPFYVRGLREEPRSLLSVPIFWQGRVIGLVNISSQAKNAFSDTDLKTIQPVVDDMAVAMHLGRLRVQQRRQGRLTERLNQYLTGGEANDVNQESGSGGR